MTTTPDVSSRPLAALAVGTLALFLAGGAAGYATAMAEDAAPRWFDFAILIGLLAAAGVSGWQAWLWFRPDLASPSSKTGRAQLVMIACVFIGVAMALVLPDNVGEPLAVFGFGEVGPVEPGAADWRVYFALFAILVVVPALAWYWHINVDELKRAAIGDAAVVAGYFYMLATGAWWIAWRGNLVPEPNGYAIFWGFVLIWSGVAAWRQYR